MKTIDLFSVEGKVAVVTGGSRGIGKMIASHLVENGCKVYIASHPDDIDENRNTAVELGCKDVPVDVTDLDSIKRLVSHISEREEQVDILVNNAGAVYLSNVEDVTEESYDINHNVNQKSIIFMVQQFLPLLEAAGASVINLSSVVGSYNTAVPHNGADYMAAKAGQNRMTTMLAQELCSRKITVNGIAPSATETTMLGANGITYDRDIYINKINPSGRFTVAEDIGAAVIYLSSRAGDYITGQVLVIDGGLTQSSTQTNEWILF